MRRGLLAAAVLSVPLFQALAGGPATAGPPAGAPRSALVVGVSAHVGNRPAAPVGGAGDAAAFHEVLKRAGWPDGSVRVLTGSAATAANIRAGLDWLRDRSNDGSFTVFHYSGHVFQRGGDLDGDGEELDEFLVPYDNRIISDRELGQRLGSVRGWLWTDISGCEAAGFNEGGLFGDRRLFTGSSTEHQKSYEHPDWRMSIYTGLTTRFAVLENQGDANGDGVVSIQEAFRHAEREAPRLTSGQRKGVQQPVIYGGGGREWFFGAPPVGPAAPAAPGGDPNAGKLCLLPGICI